MLQNSAGKGVISKRTDAPYRSERSESRLKIKTVGADLADLRAMASELSSPRVSNKSPDPAKQFARQS